MRVLQIVVFVIIFQLLLKMKCESKLLICFCAVKVHYIYGLQSFLPKNLWNFGNKEDIEGKKPALLMFVRSAGLQKSLISFR